MLTDASVKVLCAAQGLQPSHGGQVFPWDQNFCNLLSGFWQARLPCLGEFP